MSDITRLAESLPVYVKDVKLNLTSVLGGNVSTLTLSQKWGCALAVAYSLKSKKVIDRDLLARSGARTLDVAVEDPGILVDLDTPADYEAALKSLAPA